jgi:hypothetical protein
MNNKKTLLAILCLVALTVLVSAIGSIVSPVAKQDQTAAMAGMPSDAQKLTGWAWSSNIGWISFDGTGYGVYKNTDGTLHGYAWANPRDEVGGTNNIGWLQFDPGSGFPTDSTDPSPDGGQHNARIDNDGTVTGWAKFTVGNLTEGWDGWLKMSGKTTAAVNYGVHKNVADDGLIGFAWGGDVVGWVSFNPKYDGTGTCDPSKGVCIEDSNVFSVTCAPSPSVASIVPPATSVDIDWIVTLVNPPAGASFGYTWDDDDTTASPRTVTYTSTGLKTRSVTVRDSVSSQEASATCSSITIGDTPPPAGPGGGILKVFAGDEVINISEQASGLSAASIVKVSRPGAQITNEGAAAVTGLRVDSITSTKAGGGALITPYLCSFNNTMATNDDTFSSCNNLGTLNPISSEPNGKYFRLQIPAYLQAIAGNSPYKIKIVGTTQVLNGEDPPVPVPTDVSATLLFQYLVGTYTPQ